MTVIPVERIAKHARQIDVFKVLVAAMRLVGTVLVGVPYVIGWVLGKAWFVVTLAWTATSEGWRDAVKGGVRT